MRYRTRGISWQTEDGNRSEAKKWAILEEKKDYFQLELCKSEMRKNNQASMPQK